jgi:hypothetical protein
MRLSAPMHDALTDASRNPLRRTHDDSAGTPPWPAPAPTLAALIRHDLLECTEIRNRRGFKVTVWTITDLGHEALNPPPKYRADRPRFMARCGAIRFKTLPNGRQAVAGGGSGDYTSDPRKSIDRDRIPGGKMTAVPVLEADLDRFAATAREREQERKRANGGTLDAQEFEQRLEQARLVARARRMEITGEVWVIRQIAATGREQSAARRLAKLETQLQQRAAASHPAARSMT